MLFRSHPDQAWMQPMARNATGEEWGFLEQRPYALHDRDTKFCSVFRDRLAAGGIQPIPLPARTPNLNAYAERGVRSAKEECLSKLILFGEASLRRALTDFLTLPLQSVNEREGWAWRAPKSGGLGARRNRSAAAFSFAPPRPTGAYTSAITSFR